jgi:hypothetical protein
MPLAVGPSARCPYSGLPVLSCKVSDLCDCFEFPEADAKAAEMTARRDRLAAVKYVRLQVDGHTVAEFRNGSRACSCGLERGATPNLRVT